MKNRNQGKDGIFFLVIVFILFIPSCNTTKTPLFITQRIADKSPFSGYHNTLTCYGITLSLPDGWCFFLSPLQENGILLNFQNKEKTILGSFEQISFDIQVSGDKLANYYAEEYLKGYLKKSITKYNMDNKEIYLIKATEEYDTSLLLTYLVLEKSNAAIIGFTSHNQKMLTHPELLSFIVQSVKTGNSNTNKRILHSNLAFYSLNSIWQWCGDCENGFFVKGEILSRTCVVGIWMSDFVNTEALYMKTGNFDISLFPASLILNNQIISCMGTGYKNDNGFLKLYYIVQYKTKNYCIFISIENSDTQFIPGEFHERREVKELFMYHLLFD